MNTTLKVAVVTGAGTGIGKASAIALANAVGIVVVSVDVGAYATGVAFGKHPMAPTISPKKTWEGFAGSVAAAVLAGVLLAIFMLGQPWWVGVILAVTIVATATSGDLAESLIKRSAGIKDSSQLIPGHGGVLDRFDAVMFVMPSVYAYVTIFELGVTRA